MQRFYVRVQRRREHDQPAQKQQPDQNCTLLPVTEEQVILIPELQIRQRH